MVSIRLRLRHSGPGFQAANDFQIMTRAVRVLGGAEVEGGPSLGAHRIIEVRRHDADDRELLPIQVQAFTDNAGVGAKMPLPEPIAEDNDGGMPGLKIARGDGPAILWRHPQQGEQAGGDLIALDALGNTGAGQVDVPAMTGREHVKPFALLLPVAEVRWSGLDMVLILLRHGFPHRNDAVEMLEGKGVKQHGVYSAEDGGVGPDAEGQCNHRDGRKAGILSQHPKAVFQILC